MRNATVATSKSGDFWRWSFKGKAQQNTRLFYCKVDGAGTWQWRERNTSVNGRWQMLCGAVMVDWEETMLAAASSSTQRQRWHVMSWATDTLRVICRPHVWLMTVRYLPAQQAARPARPATSHHPITDTSQLPTCISARHTYRPKLQFHLYTSRQQQQLQQLQKAAETTRFKVQPSVRPL